jgi:hypothetical protein
VAGQVANRPGPAGEPSPPLADPARVDYIELLG